MSWLQLLDKYHRHPTFVLLLAISVIALAVYSIKTFAFASDLAAVEQTVSRVQKEVGGIRDTIERSALEQRIHSFEAEIFNLERLVSEGNARDLDYQRLSALRSELGTAKRMLSRIN